MSYKAYSWVQAEHRLAKREVIRTGPPTITDPCEYNPKTHTAAYQNETHAVAEMIVGAKGQWRLRAKCAALPEFSRYKVRKPIKCA